ncbi:MAG: hypothetical protein HPY45_17460 [Anaerolineae bacterium]|nr:hypothetical protein [Anaerolineae bacterium]
MPQRFHIQSQTDSAAAPGRHTVCVVQQMRQPDAVLRSAERPFIRWGYCLS